MPRRVLSIFGVVAQRVGGVEMFARELSSQLFDAGWESVVCFLGEPADSVRRFLDSPGVTIEAAPDYRQPSLAAVRETRRLLTQYRPDILHLYFAGSTSIYPWAARCVSRCRIFLTDQISRPEGYVPVRSAWWKRAARQTLNHPMSGIVAVSDYVAQCGEALGLIGRGRITRIYNGVDLKRPFGDAASFRSKYGIPADRRIVLQVSWMIPEKGIIDLLDAAKIVVAAGAPAHFVIAGEGACRAEYMEYAARNGLAGRITWTGLLEDPFGEGVYSAADVACQLSRWQEAFGWVIAEAMACGKPVIATRVGGIPEIVRDGTSGFLVAPRQPEAAAHRILQLLGDAELRRRMGEAGREATGALFDLQRNVAELLSLYGIARPAAFRSAP